MQSNQQGRRPDEEGGKQQIPRTVRLQRQVQPQQQTQRNRIQKDQEQDQIDEPNDFERVDSMIYGYLRRAGYNETADAMERESRHLPSAVNLNDQNNRQIRIINDRIHDMHLEEIVRFFHRNGQYGLNQNLMAFGEDLQHLSARFATIAANAGVRLRNSTQLQLYGNNVRARQHQQQQNLLETRPAPQAIAAMEHQRLVQLAETRYREEQRQQAIVQAASNSLNMIQQQIQAQPEQGQPLPGAPQMDQMQQGAGVFGEEFASRSSRRKSNHPQNLNERVDHALSPLVGIINERGFNAQLDTSIDFDFNAGFSLDAIRPEFIDALDFDPALEMLHQQQQQQQERQPTFDEVFDQVLGGNDQQHYDQSMVVEEEVIVESEEAVVGVNMQKNPMAFAIGPSPLLSPLSKDLNFRKKYESISQEQDTIPPGSNWGFTIPKKGSSEKHSVSVDRRDEKSDNVEKKDRKLDERGNSRIYSPPRHRSADDVKRQRDREREKERDKNQEKSTKDREQRKSTHTSSSSSHRHHRSPEAHQKKNVQSDRESSSSSSSRVAASDRKDEKERRRKEKEHREAALEKEDRDRKRKEKEQLMDKELRAKEKEKERLRNALALNAPSSSKSQQSANDHLNTVKQFHATGSGRQSEAVHQSRSSEISGPTKRKGDDSVTREYKIPKKSSSSTPKYGGSSSFEPSTSSAHSSSKSGKSSSKNSSTAGNFAYGEDRVDTTHFLTPVGHLARMTSILLNCDTTYQTFQAGLQNKGILVRKQLPQPSPCYTVDSGPITPNDVTLSNHPKGRSFAPIKGPPIGNAATKSPSSDSASEGELKSRISSDEEASTPASSSQKSRSQTPEPRVSIDIDKVSKMLNKVHGLKQKE